MAASKYHFMGTHADTYYKGDKSIPVGPGEVISLTDEELADEKNAGLRDVLVQSQSPKGGEK